MTHEIYLVKTFNTFSHNPNIKLLIICEVRTKRIKTSKVSKRLSRYSILKIE